MISPKLVETWKKDYMRILEKRPVARPQYITRETIIHDVTLRIAWTAYMWKEQEAQHIAPLQPCTWCGTPTGNYCDNDCSSEWIRGLIAGICQQCETEFGGCRHCTRQPTLRMNRTQEQRAHQDMMSPEEEEDGDVQQESLWPSFTIWQQTPRTTVITGGPEIQICRNTEEETK